MRTPSTNVAYPNTRDRLDPLQNEHGSTRQQTHRRSHVNQHTCDASSIGSTPTQSEIDEGQSNPRKGRIQHMENPHIPQTRTNHSHSHSNISKYGTNTPIAYSNNPSTSTGSKTPSTSTIVHNQIGQYANNAHIIGEVPTQFENSQERINPQGGKSQNDETTHLLQYRITSSQSHPNLSVYNATPIDTPSNSTKVGLHSSLKGNTPQRAKGNRSPIRFPTPEPDKSPAVLKGERDSSDPNLQLNTPQAGHINIRGRP